MSTQTEKKQAAIICKLRRELKCRDIAIYRLLGGSTVGAQMMRLIEKLSWKLVGGSR